MLRSRSLSTLVMGGVLFFSAAAWLAAQESTPIDWNRARQLHQRATSGEKLSADEQAYYDRAKAEMRAGRGPGNQPGRQNQPGGPGQNAPGGNSPNGNAPPAKESTGMTPLTELGSNQYKGQDGGLYGGGRNEPTSEHCAMIDQQLKQIQPLNAQGEPAADGKIVLVSIGMSNTTQEFSAFMRAAADDPKKSKQVVLVDGAQGGRVASVWARGAVGVPAGIRPPQGVDPWPVLDQRLQSAGVSPNQVQAAWIKHAQANPAAQGDFPKHAEELTENITLTIERLKQRFPNLRMAYLSSRIYAGYASTQLNPEPYAYESAFADRWVIQNQAKGDVRLNCDPAKGTVVAPAVVWGPYLWGDGVKPRSGDKLVWLREDLAGDGTHPSQSGQAKVAGLLLNFMQTNPLASGWYLARGASSGQ
ncbi:MAG: hypothetical protein JSS27_06110 [Planctomycetes bacterium]|nr:hypothetical protein [Planctomycetota bacterium]